MRPIDMEMRTGRSVFRTLYLHDPNEPDLKKDHLIGIVDNGELAAEIAKRWNAALHKEGDA